MKQRNKAGMLLRISCMILFTLIVCSIYKPTNVSAASLPKEIKTGKINTLSIGGKGSITNFAGYNAVPVAYIQYILISANNPDAAAEWISEHALEIDGFGTTVRGYRVGVNGPSNTIGPYGDMKSLSQEAKDVLASFVVGKPSGNTDWEYDTNPWWEILKFLYKEKRVSANVYNYADARKNKKFIKYSKDYKGPKIIGPVVSGKNGKQVALLSTSGVYVYQQENGQYVPGSYSEHTDISLIEGNVLKKAYANTPEAKPYISKALKDGKATNPSSTAYSAAFGMKPDGTDYEIGSYIGCYFKNYIKAPDGKNYYGRQYWIPGKGVVPPSGVDIVFEADSKTINVEKGLADGDVHEGTAEVRLSAEPEDIAAISNAKGTIYEISIKGVDTKNKANPDNINGVKDIPEAKPTKYGTLSDIVGKGTPSFTVDRFIPSIKIKVTNVKLAEMLTAGDGFEFKYLINDSKTKITDYPKKADGLHYMTYSYKYDVSIKKDTGTGPDIESVKAGRVNSIEVQNHKTIENDLSASYFSWVSGPIQETETVSAIPWTYSTAGDPIGYAEVVANQAGYINKINGVTVKAQDWNIHAGVPSTENVSAVIGGQTFIYDIAGWIAPSTGVEPSTPANKGLYNFMNGSSPPTASVKRNIEFEVIIDNWWGPDNNRCTLSCPGHTYTANCSSSSSATCNGSQTPCGICGWQVAAPGHNPVPHGQDEDGNDIDIYCDHGESTSSSCTNNASGSATYDHKTGTWSTSATNGSWTTTDGTLNANNQAYEGGTAVFNCGHCGGTHTNVTAPTVGLIDQGYTKAYGCTCSMNHNCVHRKEKKYKYSVTEYVDVYVYREIAYAKVNALTNATVKDFDPSVISTTGQKKVSNANLYANMWRANGPYENGNGRLWFTQFNDAGFDGGWSGTKVTAQNSKGAGYWLGDVKIVMHVSSDSQAADTPNPHVLDKVPNISTMRGKELMRYDNAAAQMATPTDYQANPGDKMDGEQCDNLTLHVINAWQNENNKSYKVNVISDNYVTGASSNSANVFQNIIGDVYSVDNGVGLFDYGFTAPGETHHRTHFSTHNVKTLQNMYLSDAFSLKDITEVPRSVLQTGYKGIPSGEPANKYGSQYTQYSPGMNIGSQAYPVVRTVDQTLTQYFANSTIGSSSTLSAYKDYVSKGGSNLFAGKVEATSSSYPYNKVIGDGDVSGPGITRYDMITTGSTSPETFNGFYNDHYYPNIGSFNSVLRRNYEDINNYSGMTDSGVLNVGVPYSYNGTNIYGASMVISNIKLKDYAANKAYSNPLAAYVNYNQMTNLYNPAGSAGGSLPAWAMAKLDRYINTNGYKCTYYNGYTNSAGQGQTVNDIVIHDPVSVEYSVVAGNGSGSYSGYVTDESDEDQRIIYNGTGNDKKPNYIVMGNSFHIWWSDYGDFQDTNGSWDLVSATDIRGVGSASSANSDTNGNINKDGTNRAIAAGYSNNMRTTQWVKDRVVRFSFPVRYKDINGNMMNVPANYPIDIMSVPCTDANGNKVMPTDSNQRAVPGALTAFTTGNPDINEEPKYGWDFEFVAETSTSEDSSATITIFTEAKNNTKVDFDEESMEITNKLRSNLTAEHRAVKNFSMQLVGRIGNLAIEDTSDFRFSELFKRASSTWLIPEVVHNVNPNEPIRIISTPTDLMGDSAALPKGHATTSASAVEFGTETFLGKAGEFSNFPLVASLNTNHGSKLFRQEQMRLGYLAYMDIDTMGDYYGYNIDSNVADASVDNGTAVGGVSASINKGPQSAKDTEDTRENVMTIKPMYVLYDYEKGTYHDIDLYYGKRGAYQKYWSSGLSVSDPTASLYTDLPSNMARWNTDQAEKLITQNTFNNGFLDISAFIGEDYIGTADKIVLDAYNRTFIGSSIINGAITWNNASGKIRATSNAFTKLSVFGNVVDWIESNVPYEEVDYGFNEFDYAIQAQRWYFTLGLPSSTYVVPAGTASDRQKEIETAHDTMKRQHPHSVILCHLSITVNGSVWSLEYDYGQANKTTDIVLFKDNEDIPDSVKNKNAVAKIINPVGHNGITSKMSPVLVMDAWRTSAEDWDTYGTH